MGTAKKQAYALRTCPVLEELYQWEQFVGSESVAYKDTCGSFGFSAPCLSNVVRVM
jgi:hypothetical protein